MLSKLFLHFLILNRWVRRLLIILFGLTLLLALLVSLKILNYPYHYFSLWLISVILACHTYMGLVSFYQDYIKESFLLGYFKFCTFLCLLVFEFKLLVFLFFTKDFYVIISNTDIPWTPF